MSVIPDFANGIVIEVLTNIGGGSDVSLIGTSGTIDFKILGDSEVLTVAANEAIYVTGIRLNGVSIGSVVTPPVFKLKLASGDLTGLITAHGMANNFDRFLFPISGRAMRVEAGETIEVEVTTIADAAAFTGTISILGERVAL